jgi:precorrin-6B C5,15-methyltransferase / cobalt-precorrin-6B C5,C15-methyltransferase
VSVPGAITVIGVDGHHPSGPAGEALATARLAIGAARHLDAVQLPPDCERVTLGPLAPALDRLRRDGGVVLASGDPGFFGIVRRLRAEGFAMQVHPAASSVATAFARLGLSWDGAVVVSAHGRALTPALNACRAMPLVAVLTEPGSGAAEFGTGLAGWPRRLVVLERLGTPDERISEVGPGQAAAGHWEHPHLLISMAFAPDGSVTGSVAGSVAASAMTPRADNQPAAAPAHGWALPESAYLHRGSMVTKAEVRAVAVARLRPRLGRLIWDVGAGSGSVGVECAALGAAVIAVDADPSACALVPANAARHGVEVRVVRGGAPEALADLPDPDAVFLGGGGLDVLAAVAARRPARVVATFAALDRVGPAVGLLRGAGYTVEGAQLSASRLADLPDGSLRLAATNPVVVLTGELQRSTP